jgi:hypothetical protein
MILRQTLYVGSDIAHANPFALSISTSSSTLATYMIFSTAQHGFEMSATHLAASLTLRRFGDLESLQSRCKVNAQVLRLEFLNGLLLRLHNIG